MVDDKTYSGETFQTLRRTSIPTGGKQLTSEQKAFKTQIKSLKEQEKSSRAKKNGR